MRRTLAVVVASLSLIGAACGGDDNATSDDDSDDSDGAHPDGNVDGAGVACTAREPRTTPLTAWVAPQGYEDRINALIDSAQTTLEIQMYLWTVNSFTTHVISAKNRGVAVRVLLDPDEAGNASTRTKLKNASVPTFDDPPIYSFAHAKYLIVDHTKAAIMSGNFNVDALDQERNYGVTDTDAKDVADTLAIFNQDWATVSGGSPMPADLSCTRLIVSPTNAKDRVLEHINGAQHTLDVEALYVSETSVRDAIVAAKERGVTVRVILEADSDDAMSEALFESHGIPVHDAAGFFLHAKLIVADGVPFVGSENYSLTSLTRNREVGLLVLEPDQAAIIQTQFDADFGSTH